MKITFEVTGVIQHGIGLSISLREADELTFNSATATIEIPATATAKRTYYVGRRLSLEVRPT